MTDDQEPDRNSPEWGRWAVRPENRPYSAEREEQCKAEFPYLTMSPEEYVARNAHAIGCFSLHRVKLRDERLKAWFQSVYNLLSNQAGLPALRRRYMTEREAAEAEHLGERMWGSP